MALLVHSYVIATKLTPILPPVVLQFLLNSYSLWIILLCESTGLYLVLHTAMGSEYWIRMDFHASSSSQLSSLYGAVPSRRYSFMAKILGSEILEYFSAEHAPHNPKGMVVAQCHRQGSYRRLNRPWERISDPLRPFLSPV